MREDELDHCLHPILHALSRTCQLRTIFVPHNHSSFATQIDAADWSVVNDEFPIKPDGSVSTKMLLGMDISS